jgi:hypothetical protein
MATAKLVTAKPSWADDFLTLIEDCEHRDSRLTDWERGFLDNLKNAIEKNGRRPSRKEDDILNELWDRVTTR